MTVHGIEINCKASETQNGLMAEIILVSGSLVILMAWDCSNIVMESTIRAYFNKDLSMVKVHST